ncbi:MAG: hypothetical protein HZA88_19280 [Verrucomicrobia bacterium]|nr:hypothetical protein [Verrucomicrobiota bacterium]
MKAKIASVAVLVLIALASLPPTRDAIEWHFASSRDTAQDYAKYLDVWPDGSHSDEARSRYDERSWTDAQAANSLDSYRDYAQTHPVGLHLAEARNQIEDLTWQESKKADTIKSLRVYWEAYPDGRYRTEALSRLRALHTDKTAYSAALAAGTEQALNIFLTEFPGHSKTADAKQALKDITEGRDIVDLIAEQLVEIRAEGNGISSVDLHILRLVRYPIVVRIPVGTYFVPSRQSVQNMVATAEAKIQLTKPMWTRISVNVACANRPRAVPSTRDSFTIERAPQQAELIKLMPVLERAHVDAKVRQAAVWIVTDDANYSDLGILISGFSTPFSNPSDPRPPRAIKYREAALAMKICSEAGIDITGKHIWSDRRTILRGLANEPDLKKWLEEKQ